MRDKRFVAVHRGGPLTKDHHHQLIRWARECSKHVLSLIDENIDQRLINALGNPIGSGLEMSHFLTTSKY